ncbi:extracellular solute-binding protein [Rhodospirillaceae bacterium KN72]|uniref:sn-glycerol-3-phosphate-binding periplasmic protein UgpB n=1 Tax=Pacificispira spongiicola TaxID=2729598 RepID=A0A7Y0HHZ2_9PROT|nr:extracellular solute-binding protein [Pacificispira spongiicola]NMM46402.1 extracellular solute-binding protein [Pacificispira spongiicola]
MQRKMLFAAALAGVMGASGLAQAEPTEITLWHAMGGRLGEVVDEMTAEFNASQDEYKLTSIYKGGYEDTMTAAIAAFRAGQQPDVVQVFDAGSATIINAPGAVFPVEDLMKKYGVGFDIDAYIPGVRYFYADSDGKMIGMPFNSSTPLLYFNKEALTKAGVEPPKTWEDFEAIAPKLVEAGYVPLAQSHSPWIFAENFHSRHNIQMATANNGFDSTDVKILYNNDAMKMHWSKVKDWKDKGYYGYYGRNWGDNQDAFVQGKVAMWLGSSGSFGGLRKSADFDFGTTYLPYWESITKDPKGTFIGGAALFALSGKSDEEYKGVAKFFEYMTKPETQFFWHKETGYVPITTDAYALAKKAGYYDETPDAEVGIQQLSLPAGEWTKGYRLGYYVQIREVMYKHFEQLLNGDETVDAAFDGIETESDELLDRFKDTYN